MGPVRAAPLLGRAVALHVHDVEVVHVERLALRVRLRVPDEVKDDARCLLGPAALAPGRHERVLVLVPRHLRHSTSRETGTDQCVRHARHVMHVSHWFPSDGQLGEGTQNVR